MADRRERSAADDQAYWDRLLVEHDADPQIERTGEHRDVLALFGAGRAHAHGAKLRARGPLGRDPKIVAKPGGAADANRALPAPAADVHVFEALAGHADETTQMPALRGVRKSVEEGPGQ